MRHALLIAVTTFAAAQAGAADLAADWRAAFAQGSQQYRVRIDNDSLLLNRDDGFYTSGAEAGMVAKLVRGGEQVLAEWHIGQQLYTASDINLPPARVGPPDHPYAGWLYAGGSLERRAADASAVRYGFELGCLGPCAGGEWTQKNLHRLIDQPQPQGWSKQLRNEVGFVVSGSAATARLTLAPWLDAGADIHGRFGNIFTDAGAGLNARFGNLGEGPGWQAFLRADATAVAHNATLQGGWFGAGGPHTVAAKRTVGEAEAGLAWQGAAFGLRASVIRRTNEIDGLANSIGAQNFVRLDFTLSR